ncbi:MAG: SDR family NAD(P)-dependent oxidoreductase [Actinomycetota bacterium]
MELRGANALLTGGSRGIGPSIARALLLRGATVTLAARSEDDLRRVRDQLGGQRVATAVGDVAREADRKRIVADAEKAFGAIDVLVNNAGIELVLPFATLQREEIARVMTVNLEAPIQLARAVVPGMIDRRRGHVVNISSLSGKFPPPYHTVYSATKSGLIGFTLSLRSELRETGVSASVICPGFVLGAGVFAEQRTSQNLPKRSGAYTTPKQVAREVVRAVERDVPDIIVAKPLARLADVVVAISPRLADTVGRLSGAYLPQEEEARIRAEGRES